MSALVVDVCPSSFLSYLLPLHEQYVVVESADVKPVCVDGKAPFRLTLRIFYGGAPYNGDVTIYIDGEEHATVPVTDGVVDTVIYGDPGFREVTASTAQGNAVTLIGVEFACI